VFVFRSIPPPIHPSRTKGPSIEPHSTQLDSSYLHQPASQPWPLIPCDWAGWITRWGKCRALDLQRGKGTADGGRISSHAFLSPSPLGNGDLLIITNSRLPFRRQSICRSFPPLTPCCIFHPSVRPVSQPVSAPHFLPTIQPADSTRQNTTLVQYNEQGREGGGERSGERKGRKRERLFISFKQQLSSSSLPPPFP